MVNLVLFVMAVSPCFLQCFSTGTVQLQLEATKMEMSEKKVNNVAIKLEALQHFLFGKSEEMLSEGFQTVSNTMSYLDKKLRGLYMYIKQNNCSARLDFKDNFVKVQVLAGVLNDYYNNSNEITRDLLVKACENYPMPDVAKWIHGEITWDNPIQPLIYDLERMDANEEYFAWAKLIGLTFIKASILGHACLGTVYANDPHLNEVQEIYKNKARQDLYLITAEVMKDLKFAINNAENSEDKIDWLSVASMETSDIIDGIINPNSQSIVDSVSTHFANHYPWRRWLVVSVVSPSKGPSFFIAFPCAAHHQINLTTFRTVFLASFDYMKLDDFEEHVNKCVDEYWLEPRYCGESCSCREFVEQYKSCSKSLYPEKLPYYDGIFCSDRPNDLKARVDGLHLNMVPGFKHYPVSLVKVKGGFTTARVRPDRLYSTKDIFLTPWKCPSNKCMYNVLN